MVLFIYYISYVTAWERNDIQKIIMLLYLLTDTNHKKKKCLVNIYIKFDNDHQIVNQTTETL